MAGGMAKDTRPVIASSFPTFPDCIADCPVPNIPSAKDVVPKPTAPFNSFPPLTAVDAALPIFKEAEPGTKNSANCSNPLPNF